jgi:hypothetical protein
VLYGEPVLQFGVHGHGWQAGCIGCSINFRIPLFLQILPVRHRRLLPLSLEVDPGWLANWAAWDRPVCVLHGIYPAASIARYRRDASIA